jgi:hypothetical protein
MEKPLITNSKNRIDQIRRRGTDEQAYCATDTRALLSTRPFLRAAISRGGRGRGRASDGLPRRTFDLVVACESSHNGVLSDEQLGNVVSPHLLVRNLLLSAKTSMQCLSCHLDRIEAADGDTVSLLRYYLEDSAATVVDRMALGRILGPRAGETAQ